MQAWPGLFSGEFIKLARHMYACHISTFELSSTLLTALSKRFSEGDVIMDARRLPFNHHEFPSHLPTGLYSYQCRTRVAANLKLCLPHCFVDGVHFRHCDTFQNLLMHSICQADKA